jgi:hypothetical protein
MTALFTVLKFGGLLLLTTLVGPFFAEAIGCVPYLIIHRGLLKREFDPDQQAIFSKLYGHPAGAFLISLGSLKALGFLHFGRLGSLIFFVLLVVFAIRDYADDAISNVARSFTGFLGEMLVYGVFLLKIART